MFRLALTVLALFSTALVFAVVMESVERAPNAQQHKFSVNVPLYALKDGAKEYLVMHRIDAYQGVSWLYGDIENLPSEIMQGNRPASVQVTAFAAYEVFWNNELIGKSGVPGNSAHEESPGLMVSAFFVPQHLIREQGNQLAFRYSSEQRSPIYQLFCENDFIERCHGRYFGASVSEYMLTDSYAHPVSRNTEYLQGLLIVGLFGAMTIITFLMYLQNREDNKSLWVSLTFLSVTLLYVSLASILSPFPYPVFGIRNIAIAATLVSFGIFLNLSVSAYLGIQTLSVWAKMTAVGSAVFFVFFFFAADLTLTFVPIVVAYVAFAMCVCAWQAIKRRPYALALLIILTLFIVVSIAGEFLLGVRTFFYALAAMAVAHIVHTAFLYQRSRTLAHEAQLLSQRLELELVKKNLQPHFLMNTLSAISEWVQTDPKTCIKMVEALAEEFRTLHDMLGHSVVPLREELALCRAHLEIMSFRQDRKFVLETDVADVDAAVPPAIFHTVIENALTHNHYTAAVTKFQLEQRVTEENQLQYEIHTPPGVATHSPILRTSSVGRGMGTAYINARLQEATLGSFAIEETELSHGGHCTRITVPLFDKAA